MTVSWWSRRRQLHYMLVHPVRYRRFMKAVNAPWPE